MQFPLYVTFKTDLIYILKTAFPHYIGGIRNFATPYQQHEYLRLTPPLTYFEIPNYRILVTFAGTLDGNKVFWGTEGLGNLTKEMELMAEWYHLERILPDADRYKKFKS